MHTGITTGKLYMQSKDSDEFVEVSQGGKLEVSEIDYGELDDMTSIAFGVRPDFLPKAISSETVSLNISKQDMQKIKHVLLSKIVWYRKRKGKRYNLTYRHESILLDQKKQRKQFNKKLRKWQKRYKRERLDSIRSSVVHYLYKNYI